MYEELVEALRLCVKYGKAEDALANTQKAADAIEKLIEVIQNHDFLESLIKPRWIPVTERLPEKRKWVLCRCEANIIEVLRWENNEWYHDPMHVYYPSFVTHWMPLPKPPREEA